MPVPPGVRPPIANTGDADLIFLATGMPRFAGTGDEDVEPMDGPAPPSGAVRQFEADDAGEDDQTGDQPPSMAGSPWNRMPPR